MPSKKRTKSEVANELSRLVALRDSEQSKLHSKLLRDKLSLVIKRLLGSEVAPAEILAAVVEARTLYNVITMVPGEEYALQDEIYRIEQEERMEVEAASRAGRSPRMGGAI